MKEILGRYASYNLWANHLITQAVLSLPDEKLNMELPGSFPGLVPTVLHMWDAESIWWQRLKLQERLVIPSKDFHSGPEDAVNGLLHQSGQWEDWVHQANEMQLRHVFAYQDSRRQQFKQPVSEVLQHVFNHGTYHRGQLVTMLRVIGHPGIPATDYIVWSRRKR